MCVEWYGGNKCVLESFIKLIVSQTGPHISLPRHYVKVLKDIISAFHSHAFGSS
jgi:hypothetical protein